MTERPPAVRHWLIDPARSVLALRVISDRGRPIFGEFEEFSGVFHHLPDGGTGRFGIRTDPASLAPTKLTGRTDRTELTWTCDRLRQLHGAGLHGECVIGQGGRKAVAAVRGQVLSAGARPMVSVVTKFDARLLGWPESVTDLGRPHLCMRLVAELCPEEAL